MHHTKAKLVGLMLFTGLSLASAVEASTVLRLSDLSSDETSPEVLDASLAFEVHEDRLILVVTNETAGADTFDISEIYFNAVDSGTELLLSPAVPGWNLFHDQQADGFGTFDFALISDLGNDPDEIGPGASSPFTFHIEGISQVADTNFTSEFSEVPPGEHQVIAAAKFVNGPGDDSAYGAIIPEPGTAVLVLIGCGLAVAPTRRNVHHPA